MAAAKALLALLVGLMVTSTVSAVEPELDASKACAGPPCGFIMPILDMEFEGKLPCGGGRLLYSDGPPADCLPLPALGETLTLDGVVSWYWEASEDGTYPKETGEDIVITFGGTSSNPKFLDAKILCDVDPCEFRIDDATLFSPDNIEQRENSQGNPTFWYVYEEDIQIQFTRTGYPTDAEYDRIEDREGVAYFFVKAKSSESGPRFREAFGVEEFRFNTCVDPDIAKNLPPCPAADGAEPQDLDKDTPGLSALVPLMLIGAALYVRRRF